MPHVHLGHPFEGVTRGLEPIERNLFLSALYHSSTLWYNSPRSWTGVAEIETVRSGLPGVPLCKAAAKWLITNHLRETLSIGE